MTKIKIAICVIICLTIFSFGFLLGRMQFYEHEPLINNLSEAYSYLIYGEDNNGDGIPEMVYAKNGRTGHIDFKGADASFVINAAISATNKGTILIKNGNYPITGIILEGKMDICLVGESWGAKLIATGEDTIIIRIGHRADTSKGCQRITIKNLYLDGSNQATETLQPEYNERRFGIEIAGTQTRDILIEDNYIYNTGSDSIYGYKTGTVIITKNVIEAHRAYWAAIHVHGSYELPHPWIITENIIKNGKGGIRHGRIITNNWLINITVPTGTPTGAIVAGEPGSIIDSNWLYNITGFTGAINDWKGRAVICNNWIEGGDGYAAIEVVGDQTIVANNYIKGYGGVGIRLNTATRCLIVSNILEDVSRGGEWRTPITLTGASTYNVIKDSQIVIFTPPFPYYGIEEKTSIDDYNIFENNVIVGVQVKEILLRGGHSIVKE